MRLEGITALKELDVSHLLSSYDADQDFSTHHFLRGETLDFFASGECRRVKVKLTLVEMVLIEYLDGTARWVHFDDDGFGPKYVRSEVENLKIRCFG